MMLGAGCIPERGARFGENSKTCYKKFYLDTPVMRDISFFQFFFQQKTRKNQRRDIYIFKRLLKLYS